eukprot:comp12249_c1_seq1/m.7042 comp12249_c1_seq1/g.7042  ORF comp12249_c1_seq1/g.7042 comp12249_c1_seq1/m.7042 type:complete len:138 (-) comp12249_c1_seq1:303-716(-)
MSVLQATSSHAVTLWTVTRVTCLRLFASAHSMLRSSSNDDEPFALELAGAGKLTNGTEAQRSIYDVLRDGLLLAVPKRKTSPSRKRIRNSPKEFDKNANVVKCTSCGGPKLQHMLCWKCTSKVLRETTDLRKKRKGL